MFKVVNDDYRDEICDLYQDRPAQDTLAYSGPVRQTLLKIYRGVTRCRGARGQKGHSKDKSTQLQHNQQSVRPVPLYCLHQWGELNWSHCSQVGLPTVPCMPRVRDILSRVPARPFPGDKCFLISIFGIFSLKFQISPKPFNIQLWCFSLFSNGA